MLPDEAKRFFLTRTGRNGLEATEIEAVERLARELGFLPLALEQAGAYITAKQSRFQDYLASYHRYGLEILEKARAITGKYPKSVATTWSLNFEQVKRESTVATDLLRASAFLNPDKIPIELISLGASELGSTLSRVLSNVDDDPLALDEILEPLTRYSLIHRDIQSRTYNIHRLVQAVLKEEMDEAEQREWVERVVRAVNHASPENPDLTWDRWERLLPHIQTCINLIEWWGVEFAEAGYLLNRAGFYLRGRAQYREAERFIQRALAIQENALGPEHPDVANNLTNLAIVYRDLGRYIEADLLFRRAQAIYEKASMLEHLDVAQCLAHQATLYRFQGQYKEAESLYWKALDIRKKILGPDHRLTAFISNALGELYMAQGRYAEAELLFQQTLAIREKILGPEHRDVAFTLNTWAECYMAQGRYAEAEPLCKRALEIRKKTLGSEHPYTTISLNTLADIYTAQGRHADAESIRNR